MPRAFTIQTAVQYRRDRRSAALGPDRAHLRGVRTQVKLPTSFLGGGLFTTKPK